ncbi:A/G-specific adenine glycosylase [Xylophilus sp. GOD-11R]|uniref:A/G-specific adenine glycosylase n=1 Tax=Xylophilus sp. GOD-11R TaxID=3089814 RepID=UPI00298C32CA|nr:A/G-specific adenine glycosylase [Xylophilus sp. GOD-11R]WPB56562.1 A/G-specific adenine glycosylase [Xylophilus sp. GOD-11R]
MAPTIAQRAAAPAATGIDFAGRITAWQSSHGRSGLPWQGTRDPYRVWLSEIMLQQTQVATVLDYFPRFLARLPDVRSLAEAPADVVLGLWSGLGYYSRARNLHRCAQRVMSDFGGEFPRSAEQLATLPGIGRSTASAIASFCWGERAAILDANVKRVLTRVMAYGADLARPAAERALWEIATDLLPRGDAPTLQSQMPRYTQGMMDLGATVCVQRNPLCLLCPVGDVCAGRAEGRPEAYPVKTKTLKRSAESWWLLVLRDAQGRVLLERRPDRGIWAGLHCTPIFQDRAQLDAFVARYATADAAQDLPVFLHVLTHKDLHLHPVDVTVVTPPAQDEPEGTRWASREEWAELGLPTPVRRLLAET